MTIVEVKLLSGERIIGSILDKWEDGLWLMWDKEQMKTKKDETKVSFIANDYIRYIKEVR